VNRPIAVASGVAAGLCAAIGLALIAPLALDRVPVGYTSRWHVPTSTTHNGLRYSLVKPVQCESPRSVENDDWAAGHVVPLSTDLGFPRFAPYYNTDDPVYLWLEPTGHTCLVAYHQYQEVG
jgi:hypothetical protein